MFPWLTMFVQWLWLAGWLDEAMTATRGIDLEVMWCQVRSNTYLPTDPSLLL